MAKPLSLTTMSTLAMAVGMDNGLMTPVVYNAEKMTLSELVVALRMLSDVPWMVNWLQVNYKTQPSQSVTWECLCSVLWSDYQPTKLSYPWVSSTVETSCCEW